MIVLQILYLLIGAGLSVAFAAGAADMLIVPDDYKWYVACICLIFLFWPFALLLLYFMVKP